MAICPRCKSDLPLLSKICPVCDFVIQEEGQITPEDIVNNLEKVVYQAKSVPVPAFKDSFTAMMVYVMPLITLMALVMALVTGGLLFWIIAIAAGIYSVVSIIKKIKIKKGPDKLKALVNEFEYYRGIAVRNFGKSSEVSKLVSSLYGDLYTIVENHKSSKKKIGIIWMIVIAVILILGGGSTVASVATPSQEEKQEAEKLEAIAQEAEKEGMKAEVAQAWAKAVEDYVKAGYDEISGEEARLNVVKEIIKSDVEAADKFFKQYCEGQMGDVQCAVEIVKAYKNVSEQKAQDFINSVKLRYSSDVNKLKKLL